MAPWHGYRWVDDATEATLTLVEAGNERVDQFLSKLGASESLGILSFEAALSAQGELYDRGTDSRWAVVQVDRLPGVRSPWLAALEPNGYRGDLMLGRIAAGRPATALFWNVNGVRKLRRHEAGREVLAFDPMLDPDAAPDNARDLPFGEEAPGAASLALIERWTGVTISEEWFYGPKPTYAIDLPVPDWDSGAIAPDELR